LRKLLYFHYPKTVGVLILSEAKSYLAKSKEKGLISYAGVN